MISSPELVIQDVTVWMDSLLVLDNVSLKVYPEEIVSILGPSGCGKSTLLSVIAGLIKPSLGEIMMHDSLITGSMGHVSYMTQKDLLLPWRSIVDNVSLPMVLQGVSWKSAREKALSYFFLFGLEGFESSYPSELSGGMKQRAALLRTYLCNKPIMLLDEPFGRLDAITKRTMQNWLLDIALKMKATIIMVTHDVEEAIFFSDRIYVFSKLPGKVLHEIPVAIPKPRSISIMNSDIVNPLREEILSLLQPGLI